MKILYARNAGCSQNHCCCVKFAREKETMGKRRRGTQGKAARPRHASWSSTDARRWTTADARTHKTKYVEYHFKPRTVEILVDFHLFSQILCFSPLNYFCTFWTVGDILKLSPANSVDSKIGWVNCWSLESSRVDKSVKFESIDRVSNAFLKTSGPV